MATLERSRGVPLRVGYTMDMSNDVSFALDPKGGEEILTGMAMPLVRQSAEAIAARAQGMAGSMSKHPPSFSVDAKVGIIKRGSRAIATVRAEGRDAHANYVGRMALTKSKDAGRV